MRYDAVLSESVTITGHGGDAVEAYTSRPMDPGPRGGIVVIHHLPGYDWATKEIVRRFATYGLAAICPNLYTREAPDASPDDAAAVARANGGVPDDRLVGDVAGAVAWLKGLAGANGRVATIGFCSGGRQSWLAAGSLPLDAAIVCYGAWIVGEAPADFPLTVSPLDHLAPSIGCPVLGLFGNDDPHPSPADVDVLDRLLTDTDVPHEFHRYDGAGHAFFSVDRPAYRPEAAVDGWEHIRGFLARTLDTTLEA